MDQILLRRWLKILLWIMVLVWPFGQLLIMPSPQSQIRWYALDFLALMLGISLLFKKNLEQFISTQPLFKPWAFFLIATIASLLVNATDLQSNEIFIAGSYWFRLFFLSLIYFALRIFKPSEKKIMAPIALGIFLLFGIGQYLFWPDARSLALLGFDDHYYRLIGSFFDPNFTGLVMAVITLLAWQKLKGRTKYLTFLPLLALALTFSRASYLAFAIGILYLVVVTRQWKGLILVPILVLFILFIPKPFGEGVNLARTYSIDSRIASQTNGFAMFLQKPILGHGFNTLAVEQTLSTEKFTPIRVGGIDNSFIYILATSGIVGLVAFLNLIKKIWQLAKFIPVSQAILIAIISHSWWNNSFYYAWIFVLVMFLADFVSLRKAKTQ